MNRAACAQPSAVPTENELRAVWRAMRRDTWPATFEETMQDPTRSRLVLLAAKHPPRALRKGFTTSAPAMPLEGATTRPQAPRCAPPYPRHAPAAYDRKRAAAGDRDD
jgi:hypothetical protein